MQDRLFVLQPMHDICPEWLHPVTRKSVSHLLQDLIQAGEIRLSEGEVW
jgi:7,8-dihydro-6-hydroxymethylpterin-pyrophosphokinase